MLLSLQKEQDIAEWVKKQLDNGNKIMGMGNAIFKAEDPRARFLQNVCIKLGGKLNQEHWWRILAELRKRSGRIREARKEEDQTEYGFL